MKSICHFFLVLLFVVSCNGYAKTLIIGTEDYAPPFEVQTAEGEYYGCDIDVMNAVCDEMNITCIFKTYNFHQLPQALQSGEIDLALAGIITTERRNQTPAQLLEEEKIGVYKGAPNIELIYTQLQNNLQLQAIEKMENMVAALKDKKVSALAFDVSRTQYWLSNDTAFKVIGRPFRVGDGYGVVAKLGNQQLITKVNQALTAIEKTGIYLDIYRSYF